jgi:arginyl-tRNA synthetase
MSETLLREQLERIQRELLSSDSGSPSVRPGPSAVAVEGYAPYVAISLERPRSTDHGDLATNMALVLAKQLKMPPRQVAQLVIERLDRSAAGVVGVEIAGPGFINFRFGQALLHDHVARIIRADQAFGRATPERRMRYQVEFVSANPTGPLHVAHGRGAALGDAIASLLQWAGHDVEREFYVNDAGVQINRLGESLDARLRQLDGEAVDVPEGGYHGDYLRELALELKNDPPPQLNASDEQRLVFLRDWAVERLRAEQDRDLREFRVVFDAYFSETTLYRENRLQETLRELAERGLTFEADGAVWLRTSAFGDDKDRVLVKSDGTFTYFLPDIAYHRDKARRGFDHVIDVWGADHHGYAPRMQAVLAALGLSEFLDVQIVQMVRIVRAGEEVKMSKRAGDFVSLRELYEETGVDVARYFFLMRRSDAQMLFDLDLALDRTDKNPVFKVQYAHARIASIFRKAEVDPQTFRVEDTDLSRLATQVEQEMIKQLAIFPDTVARAVDARSPHVICEYLETTAGLVNSWYHSGNPSRNPELAVLVQDPQTRAARLLLARAIQIVLRNGLQVLGLSAPERMDREEIA